jgi:RNA-binding protein
MFLELREYSKRYNRLMPPTLTARERAHLKARAHALEPVVQVGHSGLSSEVVAEVERALTAHELIKVRVGSSDRDERIVLGDDLAARVAAAIVHRVGKVVILWRPRPPEQER